MIKTFGSTSETLQTCDITHLSIGNGQDESVDLKAYAVPTICVPISNHTNQFVRDNYEDLRGLANCCDEDQGFEVDLLLGSDQYWSIVTGEVVRSTSCPTAIGTKLGFVLSGPVERPSDASINLACTHVLKCSTRTIDKEPPCPDEDLKWLWELEAGPLRKGADWGGVEGRIAE